jgi:hypothetical protein
MYAVVLVRVVVDCVAALFEQLFESPFTQSTYRGSRHIGRGMAGVLLDATQ